MKDITLGSRQLLHDLRDLQKTGLTIPDIIYNYRLVDGHLERKRYRDGSLSGDEEPEPVDVQVNNFLNAKPESKARASTSTEPGLQSGDTSYRGPLPEQYVTESSNDEKSPSIGSHMREGAYDGQSEGLTVGSDIPPPYSDPLSNPRPPLPPRPVSVTDLPPNQTSVSTSTSAPIASTSSTSPSDALPISIPPATTTASHPLPPVPTPSSPADALTRLVPSVPTPAPPADALVLPNPVSVTTSVPTITSHPPQDISHLPTSEKRISRKPVPKKEELLQPEPEPEHPAEDGGGFHKERNVRFGSIRVIGEGENGRRLVGDEGKDD
jgi:hypothetical protein